MSDTPRVDAEQDDARNIARDFQCATPIRIGNVYVVHADFARALERELVEANAIIEKSDREFAGKCGEVSDLRVRVQMLQKEITQNNSAACAWYRQVAISERDQLKQENENLRKLVGWSDGKIDVEELLNERDQLRAGVKQLQAWLNDCIDTQDRWRAVAENAVEAIKSMRPLEMGKAVTAYEKLKGESK